MHTTIATVALGPTRGIMYDHDMGVRPGPDGNNVEAVCHTPGLS